VGTPRFAYPTALSLLSNSPDHSLRHCERSEAIHGASSARQNPLLRCARNDGEAIQVRETRSSASGWIAPATAADILTIGRTRPSMPTGLLLHSRAGLRQFFELALDLGAADREIVELAVVEPVQGYARGVTLVARDHRREEAVDDTAQARQQNCSSPGKWPGRGGRNGVQHRHGNFLSNSSRNPVSLPAPFLSKACCQHGVSRLRRVRLKATGTGHGCVND
jgi:hypothetical protein